MILVTGATGLLGSYLVSFLLDQGEKVKTLIRNEKDENQFLEHENLSFSVGNTLDIISLKDAFVNVSYVYNCAGLISFSPFEKKELHQINVIGTSNIVNACLQYGVKKLCHVSSVAAIGKSKNLGLITEDSVWDDSSDNSYYGFTKYLGELEVWRGVEEGLDTVIINPSVILGSAKWSSPSMNIFKYVKERNKYYTEGGNNFVDVKDVVQIMIELMKSQIISQRFIIAGKRTSYCDLFKLIGEEFSIPSPNKKAKKWMLDIAWRIEYIRAKLFNYKPIITKETVKISNRRHEYSSQKIQKILNYKFTRIEETVNWICKDLETK